MSQDKEFTEVVAEDESPAQDSSDAANGNLAENKDGSLGENHDQPLQMITQLRLENDILKSQFEGLKEVEGDRADSAQLDQLHQQVASLSKEIDVEKQTRVAAEQALEHLREAYSEADAKAQEYSTKFSQGQPFALLLGSVMFAFSLFFSTCALPFWCSSTETRPGNKRAPREICRAGRQIHQASQKG